MRHAPPLNRIGSPRIARRTRPRPPAPLWQALGPPSRAGPRNRAPLWGSARDTMHNARRSPARTSICMISPIGTYMHAHMRIARRPSGGRVLYGVLNLRTVPVCVSACSIRPRDVVAPHDDSHASYARSVGGLVGCLPSFGTVDGRGPGQTCLAFVC